MSGKVSRKQLILEALATELERNPRGRITTASLARAVGVSEAALYRHFASKAKMFEGLIDFAEESIFVRVNQILEEEQDARVRCGRLLYLLLAFADRNPGISRVLLGDALVGETERLLMRVGQFFARLETQLRQILREGTMRDQGYAGIDARVGANLLLAVVEGRMHQHLRSGFADSPLAEWDAQWRILEGALRQMQS
ncbi:TetR family transcriptional regulator [Candidatus Endoriftia persephone str. Guaymas]|jgi:TetR/AcrR family transcriptional regulator|uniref:Nucleoid occlusion factor SlmA n=4 Tax=Gammaproteobacteria TaxID=1236 RepID=G2FFG7_9GAMM|nr:nucleoid occlusion factor SlmA [Candidatus Endoriftia persephone]MBA1331705.1 TetR family transcriptional regulator [Candidatus Endoriftia persephone str. Guaymas]EGV52070.1 division inhibitor protein [endosymbiont of Riftia pachyptila (vent Ph05)]EGW54383.1 HTH-type protein SlmA [endosymbiont of Tevnia jerichonana (vent Tica)]KRT55358.1 transcriptional regulator, TetR family [endosymbiont of Ridgeia piscesae]KRT60146.1 transcriptional regulator, TetR family [endosymbiont of Ridgeia piscesa